MIGPNIIFSTRYTFYTNYYPQTTTSISGSNSNDSSNGPRAQLFFQHIPTLMTTTANVTNRGQSRYPNTYYQNNSVGRTTAKTLTPKPSPQIKIFDFI